MIKLILRSIFIFSILFCLMATSYAEIPHLINYQGKLTDTDGNPVSDGVHSITFRIYDAADGGNLLWEETQSILIQRGIFACLLGGVTNLNIPFDKPYWLAIKVGADEEMTPRQQIASAGYAIRAERADTAARADASDTAQNAVQANNADTVDGKHSNEISPISYFVSGSYTGNGSPDRVVNVGFTPDYVFVSGADGGHRFYAMGSSYWQDGHDYNWNKTDARWKGIVTNGFQSGSNPGDDRNANRSGRLYTYIAIKQ